MDMAQNLQFLSIVELKCKLNYRRLKADLPKFLPPEAVLGCFLASGFFFGFLGYALISWVRDSWRFDFFGLALSVVWFGTLIGPILGSRLGESLDFRSMLVFPVPKKQLFFASCISSLLDTPVLGNLPLIWGMALGAGMVSSLWFAPIFFILGLILLIGTLAASQTILFLYYTILRNRQWFVFFMSFMLPVSTFLLVFFLYGQILLRLPLLEPFTRPDFPFLVHTWFLPPSTLMLAIQSLSLYEIVPFFLYSLLLILQTLLAMLLGSFAVGWLQVSEESSTMRVSWYAKQLYKTLERLIAKLPGISELILVQVMKDLRLYLREPSVRLVLILPVLSAMIFWAVLFVVLQIQDIHWPILKLWPVFVFGALFLSASDMSSNQYGMEREAMVQLLVFPVPEKQILIAKNISIMLIFSAGSLLLLLLAWMTDTMSIHSLQVIWFSSVMMFLVLLPGGNILSICFPMRMEGQTARALGREGFARVLIMLLTRLILALINTILTWPIVIFCILPLSMDVGNYLAPLGYDSGSWSSVSQTFYRHFLFLVYALGAYCISLPVAAWLFSRQKESMVKTLAQ